MRYYAAALVPSLLLALTAASLAADQAAVDELRADPGRGDMRRPRGLAARAAQRALPP